MYYDFVSLLQIEHLGVGLEATEVDCEVVDDDLIMEKFQSLIICKINVSLTIFGDFFFFVKRL